MDDIVSDRESRNPLGDPRSLYDRDLYAWTRQQADALREERVADFDWPNLVDEIGSIARQQRDRLENRVERLCHQLMLWDYGTLPRSPGRAATIRNQRRRIDQLLARSPSLIDVREEVLADGFEFARFAVLREDPCLSETALPNVNPYSWDDAMTRVIDGPDFYEATA